MVNQLLIVIAAAFCLSSAVLADTPDSSPPSRYTITHEAVLEIIIKENIHSNEAIAEGTVVIGLFGDIVPMTVLNFVTIANGIVRSNVSTALISSTSPMRCLDELHLQRRSFPSRRSRFLRADR